MKIGHIYVYQDDLGQWWYVGQSRDVARRDSQHLKGRSDFESTYQVVGNALTLVALEEVTGIDDNDLAFNLHWQETVWMFKCHTYRPCFGRGMNHCLPYGTDYRDIGIVGGRNTGSKNFTHEDRVRGGRNHRPGHFSRMGRNGSREDKRRGGLIGAPIGHHIRWHVRRNLVNPNCPLCKPSSVAA